MNKFHTILDHADPISPHGSDVSATDPQYLKDCDINTILRNYKITGNLPVRSVNPNFGDFTGLTDFDSLFNKVEEAKSRFFDLPSELRDRFGNDPRAYCRFVLDDSNREECYRLGLRVRPVEPEPTTVDLLKKIADNVTPAPAGAK